MSPTFSGEHRYKFHVSTINSYVSTALVNELQDKAVFDALIKHDSPWRCQFYYLSPKDLRLTEELGHPRGDRSVKLDASESILL